MPQQKPDRLKLLSGTFRKDRARKKNTPAAGLPVCPRDLSDDAKREWKRVGRILAENELLSRLDQAALTSYCLSWERWTKAERELRNEELVSISGNGTAFPNPLLKIAAAANAQMLKWARELGLTPAARQKLPSVPPQRAENKLSKYLKAQEKRFFGDVA